MIQSLQWFVAISCTLHSQMYLDWFMILLPVQEKNKIGSNHISRWKHKIRTVLSLVILSLNIIKDI